MVSSKRSSSTSPSRRNVDLRIVTAPLHTSNTIPRQNQQQQPQQPQQQPVNLSVSASSTASTSSRRSTDSKHSNPLISAVLQTSRPLESNFVFSPTIQPETFKVASFDCDQFISSRRHLPLEKTKGDLRAYLRQLKNELVELINKDYTDFINLSTNLVGTDKVIDELSRPLNDIRRSVEEVMSTLDYTVEALESKLIQRAEMGEKKACLQLLLNISRSIDKVEALLEIQQSEPKYGAVMNDEGGKLVERVAMEYNQLQFLVSKGKELSFVESAGWRITRIQNVLQSNLANSLKTSIMATAENQHDETAISSLTQCLRTYAVIDRMREAEDIIANELVRPFVEQTIQPNQLDPRPILSTDNTAWPATSLFTIYTEVIAFVTTKCAPCLNATEKLLRGTGYEVLTNSIWVPIAEAIVKNLPGIFASGNPTVFHANYSATMTFVSNFEKMCTSLKSLTCLRSHRSYVDLMKRWQLTVYFQLRFKEICAPFEEVCMQPVEYPSITSIPKNSEGRTEPALSTTKALVQALDRCWSDDIYLYTLSHRFWKLSLQLLSRYASWLQSVIQSVPDSTASPTSRKERDKKTNSPFTSSPVMTRANSGKVRPSSASSTVGSPSGELPTSHPGVSDGEISDDTVLVQLSLISHEANRTGEVVMEFYEDVIKGKIPGSVSVEVLVDSLITGLEGVQLPLSEIARRIVAILVKRCAESLRLIRGITGQYRHMNKKPPTEPSYFVSSILKPIDTFIETCGSLFDSSLLAEWTDMVCDAVTGRYAVQVSELVTALKATEDSLKRLKKGIAGRSGTSGTGEDGGMSDEDKIRAQVWLDVRQFGKELSSVGVDVPNFQPYAELLTVVEPYGYMIKQEAA